MRPRIVGITGGPAVGKSTVCRMLQELGAGRVDADEIAKDVTKSGLPALAAIAGEFGQELILPDGSLDRKALGAIVFAKSDERERLNMILHPVILSELRDRILNYVANNHQSEVLAVEVPLLFEVGIADWFDLIVTVAIAEDEQIVRLTHRSRLSKESAIALIHSQMPLARKIERADIALWNTGNIADIRKIVVALWPKLVDCELRSSLITHKPA